MGCGGSGTCSRPAACRRAGCGTWKTKARSTTSPTGGGGSAARGHSCWERNPMTTKIGIIVGREWSWPPAFLEEVNRRNEGVVAEYVKLGTPSMTDPAQYAVVIDRISHEVPFYRTWLKHAALQGTTVINNPFMWSSDDKFFGATLATSLGIAHPKTVLLPNREYIPGIKHDESLRNLEFPLDWEGLVEQLGLPIVLKDAYGGGWRDVYICHSLDELLMHYNNSGQLTMIAQEFIKFEQFIRCICIGQEHIL